MLCNILRHTRAAIVLALFTTACGDSTKPGTDDDDDPSQPGPPAALVIDAGNNQTAVAGEPVPVLPRVIVRDAKGTALSGVSVTFAVMSGGGTLTGATATTNTNGQASVGSWTLGEGNNVLRATVASVTPVEFTAIGTASTTIIGQATIGSGGGVLVVSKPGSALNGLTITVPANAYNGPVNLSVRANDVAAPTLPTAARIASPVITIESDRPLGADANLGITIPAVVNASEVPIVVMFDPATNEKVALTSMRQSNGRVSAVTRIADGSQLAVAAALRTGIGGTSAARTSSVQTPVSVRMIVGAVPIEELTKELDTGYRPELDDWEFNRMIKVLVEEEFQFLSGLPMASAWYFDKYRAQGRLNKKFQAAPGIEYSNPRGFRIGLLMMAEFAKQWDAIVEYNMAITDVWAATQDNVTMDSLVLLGVKAGIYVTGRPQIILVGSSIEKDSKLPVASMLVYRTHGSTMDVSLGTAVTGVNAPRSITLTNGEFSGVQWSSVNPVTNTGTTHTADIFVLTGETMAFSASALDAHWQSFFNNTIGNGHAWFPAWSVNSKDDRDIKDTIFVADDSMRVWIECPNCEFGLTPQSAITPQGKLGGAMLVEKTDEGWKKLPLNESFVRDEGYKLTTDDDERLFGIVALEPGKEFDTFGYLDWREIAVAVRKLDVTPKDTKVEPNEEFTLTANFDRPMPPNPSYEWEMGDGRKITTQTNTITTSYPEPGNGQSTTYEVKVRLKSGEKKHAFGKVNVELEVEKSPYWRLTSFVDIKGFFEDEQIEGPTETEAPFVRLLSVPGAGAITVETNAQGQTQLRIRVLRSTVWSDEQCCPMPEYNPTTEFPPIVLGIRPQVNYSFGPFFAGWGSSYLTETTLSNGELKYTGQFILGTHTYAIKDAGSQLGPAGAFRAELTTSLGDLMSGAMSIAIWWMDDKTGEVENPVEFFPFTFSGVRMK